MDNFDKFYEKMLVKVAKEQRQRDYDRWFTGIIIVFILAIGTKAIVDILDSLK